MGGDARPPRSRGGRGAPNPDEAGWFGCVGPVLLIVISVLSGVAILALVVLGQDAMSNALSKVGQLLGERVVYGLFGVALIAFSGWALRRLALRWADLQMTTRQRASSAAVLAGIGAFGVLLLAIGFLHA